MNTASSPSRSFTLNWVFCLASRVLSGSESHVSAVTTAPLFDCLPFPVPLRNHQLLNPYLGIYVWKNPNQNSWHLWHLWLSPRCYAPKWITQSFFRVKIHPALPTRSFSNKNHRHPYSPGAFRGFTKCLRPKTKGTVSKISREICKTKHRVCLTKCLQNVVWGQLVNHTSNRFVCYSR